MITVLMPTYHSADFVSMAIESILSQSYQDFELLIIDDASTDRTSEICKKYTDKRIRFIQNPKNLGLIATLNIGINEARMPYIARLDGDDVARKDRLSKQIKIITQHPKNVLCSSQTRVIDTSGKIIGGGSWSFFPESIFVNLHFRNCLAHSTVLFKKEAALAVGGYPLHALNAEDFALWHRLAQIGRVEFIPEPLVHWRTHPGSITSIHGQQMQRQSLSQAIEHLTPYLSKEKALLLSQNLVAPALLDASLAASMHQTFEEFKEALLKHLPPHYSHITTQRYLKVEQAMLDFIWKTPQHLMSKNIWAMGGFLYALRRSPNKIIKQIGRILPKTHL